MSTNFECLQSPNDITQLLRGVDYINLDALLQHEFKNPKEEIPLVFEFLTHHMKIFIKFLQILPDYFQDVSSF